MFFFFVINLLWKLPNKIPCTFDSQRNPLRKFQISFLVDVGHCENSKFCPSSTYVNRLEATKVYTNCCHRLQLCEQHLAGSSIEFEIMHSSYRFHDRSPAFTFSWIHSTLFARRPWHLRNVWPPFVPTYWLTICTQHGFPFAWTDLAKHPLTREWNYFLPVE